MKRIENIVQLRAEKKYLADRREMLEDAIAQDWEDLKNMARPATMAGRFFRGFKRGAEPQSHNGEDFLADSLSDIAATFVRKMTKEAEEKVRQWWQTR